MPLLSGIWIIIMLFRSTDKFQTLHVPISYNVKNMLTIVRCNNKIHRLNYMNKKGICRNCGDDIMDDSNSNEFCSEQCGVEYRLEHNRK